ncbi:metal ABC transporter permease [Corynebacterium belfantii]|uniref:Metal ABC transporter permease n=1 Tax=Corynebacterium belfantii TaxID=2014537 RepID=A0ABS0LAK2_9CORY|nr:metal ABC transporter permease [Corynebacterium belfantii]OLN15910.1 zinc ABC transporter permease [Corynebacterium diphtheriae subsp. lausannense]STC67433.1 manganese ABC transporter membrane protein [Corynebacterium diphtheriae]MBG9244398.1 metal ABC transporter permease [Corynebacterium belfantii]MBG9258679.1 metal ABC transporter permease [Corynebacterium belfantii]MBG9265400.1 metal ABC transporter permease [Corynebacterium belfantii]
MLQLLIEFEFVRRTMLVALMLSIAIPMLGIVMVSRRTSMMADALSHTSLAGVALGLIAGFSPVIGAVVVAVLGAFLIELLRRRFPQYGDMATAVTLSAGLGMAVILADLAPTGRSFESYLFGSITAVTASDVFVTSLAFVLVVVACVLSYGSLMDMVVDAQLARISGHRVTLVNAIFTGLAAVTVALAAKVIGALLVVSLMVLPVAAALVVARSYKAAFLLTLALGVVYTMLGMVFSYRFDVRPGGSIVVTAVIGLILLVVYRAIVKSGGERQSA